jgi:ABC-2 type transport system permease protein
MLNYIKAEHLKTKRTFLRWLIWIAPLITLTHAIMVIAVYFISDAYNWWYIVMLPATVALIPALMNRYEDRKLQYRAVFSLPVSLKKIWLSKVGTASDMLPPSRTPKYKTYLGVFLCPEKVRLIQ